MTNCWRRGWESKHRWVNRLCKLQVSKSQWLQEFHHLPPSFPKFFQQKGCWVSDPIVPALRAHASALFFVSEKPFSRAHNHLETVEKLPESGEVWAGEGFRGELAFAGLALYQLPS